MGVVIGLQALLAGFTQGETLAVAASTLRRVRAVPCPCAAGSSGRWTAASTGPATTGEQLVGAFGERLRDEVDLETIRAEVPATVDAAVRPASVGLWLRERAGARPVSWSPSHRTRRPGAAPTAPWASNGGCMDGFVTISGRPAS